MRTGIVERTFLINILDDNLVEEDEVFQVVLEIPEGGGSLGAQFRANVTIVDDDAAKLSPKFTRHSQNATSVVAGEVFYMSIRATYATGDIMTVGGERFLSIVENDNDAWSSPLIKGRGQRQAQRLQNTVFDYGNGTYMVSGVIREQGKFQLRSWHAFPGGLLGEYHRDAFFENLALSRIDRHVNFTWGEGRLLPRGADYISIRWSGALLAPETGLYELKIDADDNARLWLNGDLLIDHWQFQGVQYEPPRYVMLSVDSLNEIVMEYRDIVGDAFARLMWKPPSGDEHVVIPMDYLFSMYEISESPVELTVVSAETDANSTECSGSGLFGGTVHHEADFEVCPRDVFGNLRDDADNIYLTWQHFSATMELVAGQDTYRGDGSTVLTPTLTYVQETHCFVGKYTPERAGEYMLSIQYQRWWDAPLTHTSGSPFFLKVVPNRMDGPNSRVFNLNTPQLIEAGKCHNYTIVAHDTSHNLLLRGGNDVSAYMFRVGFFEDADEESRSIEPYDFDRSVTVARKGEIYDLDNGNYTGLLCPIHTGWYEIHVQLNSGGVSNLPFRVQDRQTSKSDPTGRQTHLGQYIDHSPYRLYVSHTDASHSKTTAHGPGLVGAYVGVPITFLVTIRDDWGNVVRNIGDGYSLTFSLGKSPGITFSTYDHNNGSLTVEYTAVKAGQDVVSVFVKSGHISGSPFSVNIVDGVDDARYSYAKGPGLIIGTTGVTSFFELFAFDLGNNRKFEFSDRYFFNTSGAEMISGQMIVAAEATAVSDSLPLYLSLGTGGDYIATFVPSVIGDLKISVFLEAPDGTMLEVSNSPFVARIHPSSPVASLTDIDGVLYDTVAGLPTFINIHLRDKDNNQLESGGHEMEMVALGVAGDWGTIQPWGTLPGLQDRYYYKGFYAGLDDVYGQWTDHEDGSYTVGYTIYTTGEYVLRLSVAEPGLNATYFNTSTFGYLVDMNSNPPEFAVSREGIPENLGSTISWTGDIKSYSYIHMFRSKVEYDINFNFSSSIAGRDVGYDQETYSSFTLDEKARESYYSVRYTGLVFPPVAEVFNISIEIDGFSTASVRIGGRGGSTNQSEIGDLVVSIKLGGADASTTEASGLYNFTDVLPRELLVEYSHLSGESYFTLYWESPSTPRASIPASAFYHWRNISHTNLTVHPASLCSKCSTAYGSSLNYAVVGQKQSFVVYGRDLFGNLQQRGDEVVAAVGVGPEGATFRGIVTDYKNSTYLVEYYATQAGNHLLYVTIGCCPDHPNVGLAREISSMNGILIQNAPFSLFVESAEPDPRRSVAVGPGVVGTTTGNNVNFSVLYRDLHNNPTTASRATMAQRGDSNNPLLNGGLAVIFHRVVTDDDGISERFLASPNKLVYTPIDDRIVVSYQFLIAGVYEMHVTMFSEVIIGAPFNIAVIPNVASANTTVCRGLGLRSAYTDQSSAFEIILSDRFGNALSVGGNKFYSRVTGSGPRSPLDIIVPSCSDGQSGRYLCTYTSRSHGPFEIHVKLLLGSADHPGGRGLKGYYFARSDGNSGTALSDPQVIVDKLLSFSWARSLSVPVPAIPDFLPSGLFSSGLLVRWEGYLVAPMTDGFTIFCEVLGFNATVYLESVLVFDSQLPHDEQSIPVSLIADASYNIRVEITTTELLGDSPAGFRLLWRTRNIKKTVIPAFYLYHDAEEIALSPFPVLIEEAVSSGR